MLGDGSAQEVATLKVAAVSQSLGSEGVRSELTHTSTPMTEALLANLQQNARPCLLLGESARANRLGKRGRELFEKIAPSELVRSNFWQTIRSSGWLESEAHSAGVGVVIDIIHEFIARTNVRRFPHPGGCCSAWM